MDTDKKKLRIFDPSGDPTLYHNKVDGILYEKPKDCIIHNPGWGLIHLNHCSSRNPEQPEPDEETMVVSIHGAYTNARTHACIAVYFAPNSSSNFRTPVGCEFENTGESLSLQAAIRAIDLITNHSLLKKNILKRPVIMTCSEYVYKGITEDIWTWEKGHYLIFPFRYTKHRANWRTLQEKVKSLEAAGISIRWWLVDVGDIAQGIQYADELLMTCIRISKYELSSGRRLGYSLLPEEPFIFHDHFRTEPTKNISTEQLFNNIGLEVPDLDHTLDIAYTMRRLVLSGQDLPENFKTLFGPDWKAQLDVVGQWKKIRVQILSITTPAQELSMVEAGYWNPRLATAEELEQLLPLETFDPLAADHQMVDGGNDAAQRHDAQNNNGGATNEVLTYEQFMPDFNIAS